MKSVYNFKSINDYYLCYFYCHSDAYLRHFRISVMKFGENNERLLADIAPFITYVLEIHKYVFVINLLLLLDKIKVQNVQGSLHKK